MRPEIPVVLLNVENTCFPLFFAKPQRLSAMHSGMRRQPGRIYAGRNDLWCFPSRESTRKEQPLQALS